MSSPHRVAMVKQLDGSRYAGLNCNTASAAMLLDRHTVGAKRTTGAKVRDLTGDTSGGTNLAQVAAALLRGWSVSVLVQTPTSMGDFDRRLRAGQGAILQGASSATRGTQYQGSETFGGNHSWFVSEGRGWRLLSGTWVPTDYLVFDPLADGRRPGIARSPFWLPRAYLLAFAQRLDLNGRGWLLGPGKAYAAFSRDTEPHAHFRFGGAKGTPFPDRTRAIAPTGRRVNVHSSPTTSSTTVVDTLADNELFEAWQYTNMGELWHGSRRWAGDHDGRRWVHALRLSHKGGST